MNTVCRLLGISKKSYYPSVAPEQLLEKKHRHLGNTFTEIIGRNPGYGYGRIAEALRQENRIAETEVIEDEQINRGDLLEPAFTSAVAIAGGDPLQRFARMVVDHLQSLAAGNMTKDWGEV